MLARAKINLALHVTGQRDDGYHLLDTLVSFTKFGDTISFTPNRKISLSITGPEAGNLSDEENNLVIQAAHLLREYTSDDELGVKIELTKNIPVASGLGGGSANAAVTLSGLMDFWQIDVGQHSLNQMALELGADVPMCLAGVSAKVQGIGEEITPVPVPEFPIVLVNPGIGVSTPRIFKALSEKNNPPLSSLTGVESRSDWIEYLKAQRNDLEAPALKSAPVIADCLKALRDNNCQIARMSGSGATCFGLFESDEMASLAANKISAKKPNWWVVATSTIG